MRIDRVFSEGEAVNALQRLGFICRESPDRAGEYIVTHTGVGGERTFTVEQLCCFAEGANIMATHLGMSQGTTAGARS